jgi:uncharacterized membrane protein YkoI
MTLLRCLVYCLPVLGLFALLPITADGYTGQRLAGKAKVTLSEASSIALRARPGAITDQELEKEKGGSGLRYSFDIKSGKATYEVGVDATSGKVLQNTKEGRHPD